MSGKQSGLIFIFTLFLFLISSRMEAAVILDDSFTSRTWIGSQTTADVDTANGWVELPKLSTTHAVDFFSAGEGVVVATNTGLKWFGKDENGNAVEINSLSFDYPGGFLGVAAVPGTYSAYAWTKNELFRVDFDGIGMSKNPLTTILGFQQVISVKVLDDGNGGENVAVLGDKGSNITLSQFELNGTLMLEKQSIPLTGDPVAVSGGFGGMDVILGDLSSSTGYMYDGSQWEENSALGVTYSGEIISMRSDGGRQVVLRDGSIEGHLWSGTQYEIAASFSTVTPTKGIALALHPSEPHYAYVDYNGTFRYYRSDGASMVEDPNFRIEGLSFVRSYIRPALYQSIVIPSPLSNIAKLTVEENHDPGAITSYEISSDGGSTWKVITPGVWIDVPEGTQFVIRSTLNSADSTSTPRILRVTLETSYMALTNLQVISSSIPAPGVTYPTSDFPVDVIAGSDIRFTIDTTGYVDRVEAIFSNGAVIIMTPKEATTEESNSWIGQFLVPSTFTTGDIIGVTIRAYNGTIEKVHDEPAFLGVAGTTVGNVRLKLVE